jgi:hypothetical protein
MPRRRYLQQANRDGGDGVMKPFLRIVLNAAMVLTLVLCITTIVAWVRSYYIPEVKTTLQGAGYLIDSWRGQVVIIHYQVTPNTPSSYLTCHFNRNGRDLNVLVKGLLLDPASVPDGPLNLQHPVYRSAINVLSRPYYVVRFPGAGGAEEWVWFRLHHAGNPSNLQRAHGEVSGNRSALLVAGSPDVDRAGRAIFALA